MIPLTSLLVGALVAATSPRTVVAEEAAGNLFMLVVFGALPVTRGINHIEEAT